MYSRLCLSVYVVSFVFYILCQLLELQLLRLPLPACIAAVSLTLLACDLINDDDDDACTTSMICSTAHRTQQQQQQQQQAAARYSLTRDSG